MTTTGDIDLMDAQAFSAGVPHDYFRELRGREGLTWARDGDGGGFWYLVRHAEVASASRNTSVFSSSPSTMTSVRQQEQEIDPPLITFLDGQAHNRMRRLTAKGFAPARLSALADSIQRIVDRLLAETIQADRFDLAEDVALQLPLEVLAELIGIPHEERPELLTWSRQTVNLGDPSYDKSNFEDGTQAFRNIFGYLFDLVNRRAAQPSDDLFSVLLAARLKDEHLAPIEIAQFATTLMSAGSETTYCSLTGGVLALLQHPDQLALLREHRELIPRAVEEILRWVTPVTHFARNVTRDVEVAGQQIRTGERIVMWYSSANRDERAFADPDRLDVTRDPNPHVAFGGGGPHYCIGNHLAVLELRCFLGSWLDQLDRLELLGTPVRTETNFMNSVKWMPARFR